MDIGKSFTYMFDDEEWVQKLAIGGLLVLVSIIPVVGWFFTSLVIIGYSLRLLKNVGEGVENPLPDWNDWGGDWVKGLMVVLAAVIYSLPGWVVQGSGWIVGWISGGGDPSQAGGAAAVCIAGLACISGLWALLVFVVFPAGMIKYATEGQFGVFFRFGDLFRFISDNLSNYIVAVLLNIVAAIVGAFGVILCVIGVFFTAFWSLAVGSHLYGQVQAETAAASGVGGYAPPLEPPSAEANNA